MSMIVQELIITSVWPYVPLRKKKNLNFLFDKCRWQVEDMDVKVAHGSIANHHLFFYQQAFIEVIGTVVATIAQASAIGA